MTASVFDVLRSGSNFLLSLYRNAEVRTKAIIGTTKFAWSGSVLSHREKGAISIGDNGFIRGEIFVFPHAGKVTIGDWVYIGINSSVWSSSSSGIKIGDRVLISSNVHIHDTDGHPFDSAARFSQTKAILTQGHPREIYGIEAREIVIHNDAWIGLNAVILKGVTIGEGAVVGACSVVTKDVPPYTVVAGNPARVIRELEKPL